VLQTPGMKRDLIPSSLTFIAWVPPGVSGTWIPGMPESKVSSNFILSSETPEMSADPRLLTREFEDPKQTFVRDRQP
jgi:hypothetical protein